ncbi:MAG: chemotaxis protein CheA [Candidatus Auribacterota bacterium]|jgi:two-component system chemotaxis sensor kinase CheA|nr:chemotaxis protein CheA [Candidatus Auribacterota bacterium]
MDEHLDPTLISDFILECKEHLGSVENNIITLENNPNDLEILNAIFRAVHSVKGGASFLGLKKLTHLTHRMENVLDDLRKEKMAVSTDIIDAILEGLDVLLRLIDELQALINDVAENCAPENMPDFDEATTVEVESMAHKFELLKNQSVQPQVETTQKNVEPEEKKEAPVKAVKSVPVKEPKKNGQKEKIADVLPEAMGIFLTEANEIFQNISSNLVIIEKNNNDQDTLNALFREIHNFKGNARYLGFGNIEKLAHHMESVFDDIRNGTLKITSRIIDLLFKCLDMLIDLTKGIAEQGSDSLLNIDDLVNQLQALLKKSGVSADTSSSVENEKKEDTPVAKSGNESETLNIFFTATSQHISNIKFILDKMDTGSIEEKDCDILIRAFDGLRSAANYMGFKEINGLAQNLENLMRANRSCCSTKKNIKPILTRSFVYFEEAIESLKNTGSEKEVDLLLIADIMIEINNSPSSDAIQSQEETQVSQETQAIESESVQQKTEVSLTDKDSVSEAVASKENAQPKSASADVQDTSQQKKSFAMENTIRVEQSKLDSLMNLIGELIINRNRFTAISRRLEIEYNIPDISKDLKQATYMVSRISDDLQTEIMSARMVQVGMVFNKFPRLVRDLARTKKKEIALHISGEDTEMDKTVIEQIGDPLVHLIRNAADHGLEDSIEERQNAGKEPTGNIYLRAFHEGNSVVIEIEDDGRGINAEKLKHKALEKGIISQDECDSMNHEAAINLIFAPGFSTAEQVSNISGRGVGMDVVRDNISKLNGRIDVKTELGKGTKISLILPLTLAIVETIMVRVNQNYFAIPLQSVAETVKIKPEHIKYLKKRKSINLRDKVIGIEALSEVIGLGFFDLNAFIEHAATGKSEEEDISIVIIRSGSKSVGFIVDELLEKQEVVIKPLVDFLACIRGISGATILGDGSIMLILEPNELINLATENEVVL